MLRRLVLDGDRVPEPRAQPAGEEQRLRPRRRHRDLVRFERPRARELASPALRPFPGDVRDHGAVEALRELCVAVRQVLVRPLGRVDDQPVDDVHELVEHLAELGHPAPAHEDRQVRDQERDDDARRMPRPLAAEAHADHLGAHGTVAEGEALHRRVHFQLVFVLRPREEEDRARGMLLREAGERPLRRVLPLLGHPGEMRHHARALVRRLPRRRRRVAQRGELALDLDDAWMPTSVPTPRRGRRAGSARSALAGPHVPAA